MAKKKKHHTTHRRRRVSGISSTGIMHTAMEAGGVVVGSIIAKKISEMSGGGGILGKAMPIALIFGGTMLKKHSKSPLMSGVGWGMVGAGGIALAGSFGIIRGVDDFVSGLDGDINGGEYLNDASNVRGIDNGYTVNGMAGGGMAGAEMAGAFMM